jgi:hypothetical protein
MSDWGCAHGRFEDFPQQFSTIIRWHAFQVIDGHSFAKSDRYRALRNMEIVAALGLAAGEMNRGHGHDDLL